MTARKPTRLKLLEGTLRPDRTVAEPIPDMRPVEPPSWLPADALAVWDDLAPDLVRKDVLTHWDVRAFARYCWLAAKLTQLAGDLDDRGLQIQVLDRRLSTGAEQFKTIKNPSWQQFHDCERALNTLGARFGLTPSDRAGLDVKSPSSTPGRLDPARLLS